MYPYVTESTIHKKKVIKCIIPSEKRKRKKERGEQGGGDGEL